MGTLKHRLAKLEQATGATRCDACRDWPAQQVVYVNDPHPSLHLGPDTPEHCPACGGAPLLIQIRYAEDWPPTGA